MVVQSFPPVDTADEHGILAIGGDLEVESLLLAYSSGIFPWPFSDDTILTWFAPDPRAILEYRSFHIPRSARKEIRKANFNYKINTNFSEVITSCANASNRKNQDGTWITNEMIQAYITLHEAGYAHSIECYQEEALVGGLYGVSINGFFAGESMFHSVSAASKACLIHLMKHLHAQGINWMDCQQLTPLLSSFGAKEIPRKIFMERLNIALKQKVRVAW